MTAQTIQNQILQKLAAAELALLQTQFVCVNLSLGEVLVRSGEHIPYAWFPESGVLSTAASAGGRSMDVNWIGAEGMTSPPFSTEDTSPHDWRVLIPGKAFRIDATAFAVCVSRCQGMSNLLYRYRQTVEVQASFNACANGVFSVRQRVARLLLMLFDRVGPSIKITQADLGDALGIRRASVTAALLFLEQEKAISSHRSRVDILDSFALDLLAGGSYGPAEDFYRRTMSNIPAHPVHITQGAAASAANIVCRS